MSIRGLNGWQTTLADLALILFVVVAAAHREDRGEAVPQDATADAAPTALGQPMGVFRPGGDADLAGWLATQDLDRGEIATVIVRYRPGRAADAVREATRLIAQIEDTGQEARLMVEPAAVPETLVVIAHDRPIPGGTEIAQ
ncbi:hypothetical protein [Alteriqipengyuania sp. 357]